MGVTCCNEAHGHASVLAQPRPSRNSFKQTDWPENDQVIQSYLKQHHKQFSKPQKQVDKDYYYLGQWDNGKPFGEGLIYIPGKIIYYGHVDRTANGKGKANLISSQCSYQGNFSQGEAFGQGTFQNTKENYTFKGQWLESRPLKGILRFKNNNTVIEFIQYAKSIAKINYHDGKVYSGQIDSKTFLPSGVGQVTFPDKSTYNGEWQNGKMHGKGVFQWKNPHDPSQLIEKYQGDYQLGKKHGYGIFHFSTGKIYEGKWEQGKMHGQGKLTDRIGKQISSGYWNHGQFIGKQPSYQSKDQFQYNPHQSNQFKNDRYDHNQSQNKQQAYGGLQEKEILYKDSLKKDQKGENNRQSKEQGGLHNDQNHK